MSIAGMRAVLKTALDTVDGVRGYEYRPDSITDGDAWPVRGPAERDQASGLFLLDWGVQVVLPSDPKQADAWMDAHVNALVTALGQVAYVTGFVGVSLSTDEYALELQLGSE
jgi:hypothetical protein